MILPMQIRAARSLLGINQQELAAMSSVGLNTIKRIEASDTRLSGTTRTMHQIHKALYDAGVDFIAQDENAGPGVRLKNRI